MAVDSLPSAMKAEGKASKAIASPSSILRVRSTSPLCVSCSLRQLSQAGLCWKIWDGGAVPQVAKLKQFAGNGGRL